MEISFSDSEFKALKFPNVQMSWVIYLEAIISVLQVCAGVERIGVITLVMCPVSENQ